MVISLLETVIITNVLHHNSMKYRDVPRWVRVVVLEYIGKLICYRWPEENPLKARGKSDNSSHLSIQAPAQSMGPNQNRNSKIDFFKNTSFTTQKGVVQQFILKGT